MTGNRVPASGPSNAMSPNPDGIGDCGYAIVGFMAGCGVIIVGFIGCICGIWGICCIGAIGCMGCIG